MDIFKKQQIIEVIKVIIKARWFFAATVFVQGLIIKFFFPTVPLARTWQLTLILIIAYLYNLSYWLYLRRSIEKIADWTLSLIKNLQIFLDALIISAVLYFSGTIDKLVVVWYFVILMIGIALYQKKGIIISVFICISLYNGLGILEYYGFLNPSPEAKDFISVEGNLFYLGRRLVAFNSYIIAAGFFAWFLGNLFRQREERLIIQKNELAERNKILTLQKEELIKTKNDLELSLTRSDLAQKAAIKAREEMEKINLELKKKIEELERFYKMTVGREVRIVELKKKIKELEEKNKKRNNKA